MSLILLPMCEGNEGKMRIPGEKLVPENSEFPEYFAEKISDLPEKRRQKIRQKRKLTGGKIR